jgi:signal transduction histidine kinase
MALSDFIRTHHPEIIAAFEEFAQTLIPAGTSMTSVELRDHAAEMLTAIVEDLGTGQSASEQGRKSKGLGRAQGMAASGIQHADARIRHGFAPPQLLAEFRALRASVLSLYERSGGTPDVAGIRRFNESIDEVLTESMTRHSLMTDAYRDQFIGVLSHDLRNPLNAITAGAALLTMSGHSDERQARVASSILSSAQRMGRMIHDLLDLTRARLGGEIPLDRKPTDLAKVCQEALLEIQTAHPAAVLQFQADGDLTGEWDSDRLAQVLSNLVGNAVQHGEDQRVTLTATGSAEQVTISVHNFGAPIPPESRGGVFEPFVRGGSATGGDRGSLGLGLFIARTIVVSHGGEIGFDSSTAEGTTFTLRLPRTQAAAIQIPAVPE